MTDLYDKVFEDGDFVFVITDNDDMYQGYLYSYEDCIELYNLVGKSTTMLTYDIIRFMAHDGLPIMKVRGTQPQRSQSAVDIIATAYTDKEVRKNLSKDQMQNNADKIYLDLYPACKTKQNDDTPKELYQTRLAKLYQDTVHLDIADQQRILKKWKKRCKAHDNYVSSSSFGDPFEFIDIPARLVFNTEPALLLEHPNGAKGILWDLPSVFDFHLKVA